MTNSVFCQLWMGNLEPYMTETFILSAFRKAGENPLCVKVMRNKVTGEQTNYCFVHFENDEIALNAMHKLNSKPIPDTNPVVKFRLNNASNTGKEFSAWVGELSPDVDDFNLYRIFATKYHTIKTAKVILDNSGYSKGYGFVRFGSEDEMKDSLIRMNGYIGLGMKALKISNAIPKPKGVPTPSSASAPSTSSQNATDVNHQYYDSSTYWQNYALWQTQTQGYSQQSENQIQDGSAAVNFSDVTENTDLDLIEHTPPLDIEKMNKEKIDADCNLWDALESSKWLPLETIEAG